MRQPPRSRQSLCLFVCLFLCLAMAAPAAPAQAPSDIHRCNGPGGQTVYSDRRCEDLGASARMPPPALRDGETGLYRYGCPRRLSELVGLLRTAIDGHDVNRLSSLYLWNDIADPAANHVLTQLEAIAERPLLDIAPMYPADEEDAYVPASEPAYGDPPTAEGDGALASPEPAPPPLRPRPWGLRLEQVLANGSTPSRTVLRLRRQYNCFWVSF